MTPLFGGSGSTITHKFVLDPTSAPEPEPVHLTVSGETGVYPSPFDLEPGQWTVTIDVDNTEADHTDREMSGYMEGATTLTY